MGLRDIESTLPPGFRFYPSDEELICHYLYKKVAHEKVSEGTMVEVDLHTHEPWELPDVARLSANEWYFFSFRDRKYATGSRTNRATRSGYWKATGKDRIVNDPTTQAIVGMRKTLVFYRGRAPEGIKTGWVMHEFRLENPHSPPKEDWVLCRVFHKRKGETLSFGLENEQEINIGYSSPPQLDSPPPMIDHPMSDACYDPMATSFLNVPHQEDSSSSTFLNLAVLHYNFIDFPQEMDNTHMMAMGSRVGDDFGFLFDASLQEHEMGQGSMATGMGGTRFQDGKDKIFL